MGACFHMRRSARRDQPPPRFTRNAAGNRDTATGDRHGVVREVSRSGVARWMAGVSWLPPESGQLDIAIGAARLASRTGP
ncbi:hypothetical protein C7S14_7663 [Burkholderia cepacia]|nr:hypothetical protein C7S14_7663 [Burkholderia cepacia]